MITQDHLYNSIVEELRGGTIPGWCDVKKALDLASTVVAMRPKVIVEIGVFGGRSLIPMAMACDYLECGQVIAIDPWDPEASTEGYTGDNAQWWRTLNHQKIYEGFLANLQRLELMRRVSVLRMKSDDVSPPAVIDVCHLDGQHTEQAIRDVKRFAPNVRLGGVMAVDDTDWQNNGVAHVSQAVEELKKLGFVQMYPSGTGAFFQRTKK